MTREHFEEIVELAFERLPAEFRNRVDNVQIVVEDYPSEELQQRLHVDETGLLGLYQGIPLPHRTTWYGTSPTVPDTIHLFQRNIESVCRTDSEVERRVAEVLLHELGHFFGMNERQVRQALKNFQ